MVGESSDRTRSFRASRCAALLLAILLAPGCTGRDSSVPPLTADVPLHLEEHLDAATITGSEASGDLLDPVEWRFDEPQPDWQPVVTMNPNMMPVQVERTDDALRLTLDESNWNPRGNPRGGIAVELPGWSGRNWGSILVRARASNGVDSFAVGFNTRSVAPGTAGASVPYAFTSVSTDVVNDGTVVTYLLQPRQGGWGGSWNRLGLWLAANGPATFEVLSISVIPTEADYADAPAGTRSVSLGLVGRQALYSHAPGRIDYRVVVPPAGRLDVGLGVLREDVPVTFRIAVTPDGWRFPDGTVFVKHFERDGIRLETRVIQLNMKLGFVAATYVWDGNDAVLAHEPRTVGSWTTLSPQDCGMCHNENTGFVLGVNARQLHRGDQLARMEGLDMFAAPLAPSWMEQPRLVGPDGEGSLETRVRSYLDANCAQCHRPGGVRAAFDARFTTPLEKQGLIHGKLLQLREEMPGVERLIVPGKPQQSMLWRRLTATDKRMPPLGIRVHDSRAIGLLSDWITQLR